MNFTIPDLGRHNKSFDVYIMISGVSNGGADSHVIAQYGLYRIAKIVTRKGNATAL